MTQLDVAQIRSFRLEAHHLDGESQTEDILALVGACGMQNTPPGAWETALYNRLPHCPLAGMERLLYEEKTLLQAWSFRGAPVVFPTAQSEVFLSALMAQQDEPWIYTPGITLALDFLNMGFDALFEAFQQVMPRLDEREIVSKTALDAAIAQWMLPLLPPEKRELWNAPSMYGSPDKQTVGGAVASFLLRPGAFSGLVVFGRREGISPVFTSYQRWTGRPLEAGPDAANKLVRKFLHCYGPAIPDSFVSWLGCSRAQGRRMWDALLEEMEPVRVLGKRAFILSSDRERLHAPASFSRELLLLGGHDPYLDCRDRLVLQPEKALHKRIWKTVSNPGAVVHRGEVVGSWSGKRLGRGMEISMALWSKAPQRPRLLELAEEYAAFRGLSLLSAHVQMDAS